MVSRDVLDECAALFSGHYGVWSLGAPKPLKPGSRVRMSADRLAAQSLYDYNCGVAVASNSKTAKGIVGSAFYTRFKWGAGHAIWVTQLCVHKVHRGRGLAKRLLSALVAQEGTVACGLVTCHPHGIRALESVSLAALIPWLVRACLM
jgi:GNAT superfamily N-acetyltransferase